MQQRNIFPPSNMSGVTFHCLLWCGYTLLWRTFLKRKVFYLEFCIGVFNQTLSIYGMWYTHDLQGMESFSIWEKTKTKLFLVKPRLDSNIDSKSLN